MKTLGYYNGTVAELEEVQIPLLDRANYFGDAVYDATYSANHVIFALDEHVERFYNSMRLLDIRLDKTPEELKLLLQELVDKVDTGEQFVYWQANRGTAMRSHAYGALKANLLVMLTPKKITSPQAQAKLLSCEDTRYTHCNIKTVNLLPNVMAAQKAEAAGCQEAVFHRAGRVTECAHSNISMLKDGTLYTAPLDQWILPGIARAHLLRACERLNIPVREEPFMLQQLFEADEIIVTSSGSLCYDACVLDDRPVGGKDPKTLQRLKEELFGEFYSYCGIKTE